MKWYYEEGSQERTQYCNGELDGLFIGAVPIVQENAIKTPQFKEIDKLYQIFSVHIRNKQVPLTIGIRIHSCTQIVMSHCFMLCLQPIKQFKDEYQFHRIRTKIYKFIILKFLINVSLDLHLITVIFLVNFLLYISKNNVNHLNINTTKLAKAFRYLHCKSKNGGQKFQ